MNEITGWGMTISCDECSMQCSAACDDCVVTFLLRADAGEPGESDGDVRHEPLVLDLDQVRVVRLLGKAGLVPELRFQVAS